MRTLLTGLVFLSSGAFLYPQSTPLQSSRPLPRHLFSASGPLTEPAAGTPVEIAATLLQRISSNLGLSAEDAAGIYVAQQYRSDNNGVTHVLFRQRFENVDVYGSAYTINVSNDGSVLNAGGDLYRRPAGTGLTAPDSGAQALQTAVREINPSAQGAYLGVPASTGQKLMRFSRGGLGDITEGKPVWYPLSNKLRSAWLFYIPDANGIDLYATVVDASSKRMLRKLNLTRRFQQSGGSGLPAPQGLVFDRESPQPNPTPGVRNENRPYVDRVLKTFVGDPIASPRGWVDSNQTVGNNVIAGTNSLGTSQTLTPRPATAPDRNFSFPLQLGPGAPSPTNFDDAATTNLFYWANIAHDRFYGLGFNEAAGNFQQDNFGRGGIGGDPMLAYSHFGIAAVGEAITDNSYFLSNRAFEDGSRISINLQIWMTNDARVFTDVSFDNEVIVHEYTHGVSNRLAELVYQTEQGFAMGEGWSDYFGLEFTLPYGIDPDGSYPLGEYGAQLFGTGFRTRPYSTQMDINSLTFADFGRVRLSGSEVHDNGEIWMEALWESRAALIRQYGEREGRGRMAQIIIDGMKLAPPQSSMIDMRDAILLADRVDYQGASQRQLWEAFAKRGFGTVAFSSGGNSFATTASFDVPSNQGTLRFEWDKYTFGEQVRVLMNDSNNLAKTVSVQLTTSSGDVETVVLRKEGETFTGTIPLDSSGTVENYDSFLTAVPGDYVSVYYVDADTGSGSRLIETTAPVMPGYSVSLQNAPPFTAGRETSLFTALGGFTLYPSPARITLPFPFKFYGADYRVMFVSANGFINFGLPAATDFNPLPCATRDQVAQVPTIAPLMMELAYGGLAQLNEGVFYSTTAGAVTIRWAAETVSTGEAVNFSVILYDDGRIVFQYGSTNNDLTSSEFFGCSATAPLVGISNGHGTFTQTVDQYSGFANLGGVPNVVLDPPFNNSSIPVVNIESPEPSGAYTGIVTVRGTAYDPNDAISRLDLIIDGVARRRITPNLSRPDICSTQAVHGCPAIGFQTSIDFTSSGLVPGEHTFQIQATNSRGAVKRFPEQPMTITVIAGQSRLPVAKIESPVEGTPITGSSPVRGYAYASDLRILEVDVIVDGTTYGQALYGLRRDDICATLNPRPLNCPNIGFSFTLNSITGLLLPNGLHSLQVRILDESGRLTLSPETPVTINVDNTTTALPTGVLSNPQPNSVLSGTVKIWGWAWSPAGTVRSAFLAVDGVVFAQLNYGDQRPEQCSHLPDVKACPNIGFWGDFDTTVLTNGVHQLGVLLVDNRGNSTVIPTVNVNGENVVD